MNKCVHHWILECNIDTDKPTLTGECKKCGEKREYPKYIEDEVQFNPRFKIRK